MLANKHKKGMVCTLNVTLVYCFANIPKDCLILQENIPGLGFAI